MEGPGVYPVKTLVHKRYSPYKTTPDGRALYDDTTVSGFYLKSTPVLAGLSKLYRIKVRECNEDPPHSTGPV